MKVFALVFTIGISSGCEELIGLYSTKKRQKKKQKST